MIEFKTLKDTSFEKIHEAFIAAFSDYQVPMKMSLNRFVKIMIEQNGIDKKVSVGAFDGEKLVGFMLVGLRKWNGEFTAYDGGTGVIKEYRNQSITSNIFEHIKTVLKENNINNYLLEVITTNDAAVHLYKKQGFEVVREFKCFITQKDNLKIDTELQNVDIEILDRIDNEKWEEYKKFWDFKPSWQNSIDSINMISEDLVVAEAKINSKIVGYIIMERRTGDIKQLAVDKAYRNQNIAKYLVKNLAEVSDSKKMAMLNIESSCESLNSFMIKLGFNNYVNQYEMILNIV